MFALQNVSLGVYYPGNSPLHRLRARTKLLVLLWLIAFLLIANQRMGHYAPYALTVALLALSIALSGISPMHVWRRMWLLVLITVLSAPAILFFLIGKPVATFGPVMVSYAVARWAMAAGGAGAALYVLSLLVSRRRDGKRRARRKRIAIWLALGALALVALYWITREMPGTATFPLGPLSISDRGIWVVMSASMVLLVFYALALLLTMTTSPVALVEGMTLLLGPFRRLGMPVDDFALMMLISLRFIPTLVDEADQLMKAQIARGADITTGSLRERLQSLETWFVPLIQGTMRRASDLATALEARGYEVEGQQTRMHEGPLHTRDWLVLVAIALTTAGSLLL